MRQLALSCLLFLGLIAYGQPVERVTVGSDGVLRWTESGEEVAVFGANYTVPSASDYRAAGYAGMDRKEVIRQDLAHFKRLGWDGLRVALWGDWENSDAEGNLIVNDHLDLFTFLVAEAEKRGFSLLLTPIHRHDSRWPEMSDPNARGFASVYPAEELGRSPQAIRAQENFLRQFLNYVNPYTGRALKDEPSILFIELINEPAHHADDTIGSLRYLEALAEAVRSTGCRKPLFHNLSQDFRMLPVIAGSSVDGFTLGWYPTALMSGATLPLQTLRSADSYTPLLGPDVPRMPRLVYEFDAGDTLSPLMHIAMVREFRRVGVQFATLFGYDMISTADRNLGWQTHYLSLLHTPNKAIGTRIAAEVMRTFPRGQPTGGYPANTSFGATRLDPTADRAECINETLFLHTGPTTSVAPHPERLRQIAGVGSSPLIEYNGTGAYFLDKIEEGIWRLEVYPDAFLVRDPFGLRWDSGKEASRLVWNTWPMTVKLPDLGETFSIQDVTSTASEPLRATQGQFSVKPGVYVLSQREAAFASQPEALRHPNFAEFHCPPPTVFEPFAIAALPKLVATGTETTVVFDLAASTAPTFVSLEIRSDEGTTHVLPLKAQGGPRWLGRLPELIVQGKTLQLALVAEIAGKKHRLEGLDQAWKLSLTPADAPWPLLQPTDPETRPILLAQPHGVWREFARLLPGGPDMPARLRLEAPPQDWIGSHHACGFPLQARIPQGGAEPTVLRVIARGNAPRATLSLIERDGSAWATSLPLQEEWRVYDIPLTSLQLSSAYVLPVGYPGTWNHTLLPPTDRGFAGDGVRVRSLDQLQLSLSSAGHADLPAVEVARVELR